VPDTASIMNEESFAPVAPITPFGSLEEALRGANSTDLGLASYVFTNDLNIAFAASDGLQAGMVAVNHMAIATVEAPFGGVKESGFSREGGSEGILDYTNAKFVSMAL
jgi:succinate-semialdehyde dehydrogenase / glutarate-semialdehyde dehydrogenase